MQLKGCWTRHSRRLDDEIFFVASQRRRKAYQSTSLLQQSETLKMEAGVSFLFFVCLFFRVSFPKKESQSQVGLSKSCSATFQQLLVFRATFCFLSNFSRFLVILRYRKSLQCSNSSFLKRSQILLPGADHGRNMHAAGLLGQRFLKENLKWRTQPVSGEEGHSTILLVHTRIFTRLILILTGAHDYEAMGS